MMRRDLGALETPPSEILEVLRELVIEVRGLRADLMRARSSRSELTRSDRARLARLLPAIAGARGSEPFSSRDLAESESAAEQLVIRGMTAHAIGRLLWRACGVPIDGWLIERLADEFHAAVWRVVAVGDASPPTPCTPAPSVAE